MAERAKQSKGRTLAASPDPASIIAAREAAGLTQSEAGELVHTALRTWQHWEAGGRQMPPAIWELFLMKTALIRATR